MFVPPKERQNPLLTHWVLPGVLLAGMIAFDYRFLPGATITPVCCFLVLALMAFILPPLPMIFWACVYSLGATYTIFHPEIFMPGLPDLAFVHRIRTVGIFSGAFISVLLSLSRLRAARKTEQLNLLVREIPVPFVLSDGNGEIIFMNTEAAQLLGVAGRKTEGDSYFTLITDANQKGHAIQKYLEVFDAKTQQEFVMELRPKNNPGASLRGTLIPVEGVANRYLITMISKAAA